METVATIGGLLVALILGGVAGWLSRGARPGGASAVATSDHQAELANLRLQHERQSAERQGELSDLRLQNEQRLSAKQEEMRKLQVQHEQQLAKLQGEIARLKGELEQVATTQQLLEAAKAQFSETAKLTATEALQGNNDQFLKLANENLGKTLESASRELHQRHQQFQELVKPLSENYVKLNPQIEALARQHQSLAEQTGKLSSALTENRQAGRWGEVQLRRVIDLAGMTDYCDFAEQQSLSAAPARPDLIIRLPEKRTIVVDAKASTLAYMEAQQTEDPENASAALAKHAQAMRGQVEDLAGKNYGAAVDGSLDFVVMFVPGDQFLAAALSSNPGLIEFAMSKRVAIATPASLISMLWAVANGWQQFRLAEDAQRIKDVGEEMYKRLRVFINHYTKIGDGLESAVAAYNRSVGSFDQRVAPQGRRFAELVVGSDGDFTTPDTIEGLPRISAYATSAEGKTMAADDD